VSGDVTLAVSFAGSGSAATVARSDHTHDDRYYTETELQTSGSAQVHWNNLTNVPAGLDDGDDDTTYSAGTGLDLTGTTFSADTTYMQRRVSSSCTAGSSIRAIAADGTVTCETDDDSGGDITAVTADTGLSGGGTSGDVTVALGTTYRLPQSCSNGQIAEWNSTTSQWQCGNDDVGSTASWLLSGNAGTNPSSNYLGTSDNQALELRVNNSRALRLEPNVTSPNIVGGYSGNSVTGGAHGVVIGGGGYSGTVNSVTDSYGTVGGGVGNRAGDNTGTTADALYATVGGGYSNTSSASYATIGCSMNKTPIR
jgi:hypothetical protein